jgi:hypothetical protein
MPKPHAGEKRKDFVARCMGDAEAARSFPREAQRLAFCHNTYAEHVQHAVQEIAVDLTAAVRTATFLGRQFRVVPAVLVRSQVLRNNLGKSFLPAEDITDDWAEQWNGMPVLVGDHPRENGVAVTGRRPGIWDARCVGWIFNAAADTVNGTRRLVGEVWLDEARSDVPGFQAVLARVAAGQPVELSTGFSTQTEPGNGVVDGETYELIMHPLAPDHLVISSEMTGACSTRDGCGLGANGQCQCGGKCQHQRENATMASDAGNERPAGDAGAQERKAAGLTRVVQRVAAFFGARATAPKILSLEECEALAVRRELDALHEAYYSDEERAGMIRDKLQTQFGDADRTVVVTAVFGDQRRAVFWFQTPMGAQPRGAEYYQSEWTEGEQGMTFAEPTRVRRMTTYEPVAANADVSGDPKSAGDPANAAATTGAGNQQRTEEDAAMAENKEVLDAIAKLAGQVTELSGQITATNAKVTALESSDVTVAGLKKTVGALAAQVEKMGAVAQQAIEERERERQSLIASLAGNYRCAFNEAELEGKPIEELRKIADMVKAENFAGRGGPQGGGSGEKAFVAPKPYWETDAQDKSKK